MDSTRVAKTVRNEEIICFVWRYLKVSVISVCKFWLILVYQITSEVWANVGILSNSAVLSCFLFVQIATRKAYGTALIKIGNSNDRVVSLDCDTKNSTFADDFRKAHPDKFVECFIAEQNMVGLVIGVACRDRTVAFGSTFACFLSRAYDQIRMGAISQTNANFCGSHAGISIGKLSCSLQTLLVWGWIFVGCIVTFKIGHCEWWRISVINSHSITDHILPIFFNNTQKEIKYGSVFNIAYTWIDSCFTLVIEQGCHFSTFVGIPTF